MKDAYLVKKSVKRNPLKPSNKITIEEYLNWVETTEELTWLEETRHGEKQLKRDPKFKLKNRSYLNYNPEDEKSFVHLLPPYFGYISIQFDFKSTKENLHNLVDLANKIDCNLWQYSPKRQILTHEIIADRNKRKKKTTKN